MTGAAVSDTRAVNDKAMEETDKKILQNMLAMCVGRAVNGVLCKEKSLDEDIHIDVVVDTPSCYVDDKGETHTGKLITVVVDFISGEDGDDDD